MFLKGKALFFFSTHEYTKRVNQQKAITSNHTNQSYDDCMHKLNRNYVVDKEKKLFFSSKRPKQQQQENYL